MSVIQIINSEKQDLIVPFSKSKYHLNSGHRCLLFQWFRYWDPRRIWYKNLWKSYKAKNSDTIHQALPFLFTLRDRDRRPKPDDRIHNKGPNK